MQLKEEYEAATGDAWPLNVGQVYTTLQRLERDGLVDSNDAGDDERQRGYQLTGSGRAELDEWLTTPPGPDAPPATSSPPRCSWRYACRASTSTR